MSPELSPWLATRAALSPNGLSIIGLSRHRCVTDLFSPCLAPRACMPASRAQRVPIDNGTWHQRINRASCCVCPHHFSVPLLFPAIIILSSVFCTLYPLLLLASFSFLFTASSSSTPQLSVSPSVPTAVVAGEKQWHSAVLIRAIRAQALWTGERINDVGT